MLLIVSRSGEVKHFNLKFVIFQVRYITQSPI